ncbi:MAG: VCBS repeat-containing protein [Planctomycetes bacterium]|nr:VCBS repeat-containing protein [Planctomycetota bacterium]
MQRTVLVILSALLGSAELSPQRVVWSRESASSGEGLGTKVRAAGDVDGDGADDVLVTAPYHNAGRGRVLLLSGRTGAVLRTFSIAVNNSTFGTDAAGIDDCNGDGIRDIVISGRLINGPGVAGMLFFFSGANGAPLLLVPGLTQSEFGSALCPVGDVNGDGRGDVAVAGSLSVELISGANGLSLGSFSDSAAEPSSATLRVLPDLDADGHAELLLCSSGRFVRVLDPFPVPTTRVIPAPAGSSPDLGRGAVGFADLDGNGVVELLLGDDSASVSNSRGVLYVVSPLHGALLDSIIRSPFATLGAMSLAGAGDLDADGHDDVVLIGSTGIGAELEVLSGRTRTLRGYWAPSSQFAPLSAGRDALVRLGDADGNGFAELALGNPWVLGRSGQCFVFDTRFLASSRPVGSGCGAGPFLPQLGISRPILGTTAQVVLRDAPVQAPGLLVLSAAPRSTTNLGAVGCDLAFDLSAWAQLANLGGAASYSLPLPIPPIPQFAGLDLALQAFFLPTGGPLGFDLSNGVWARIGS